MGSAKQRSGAGCHCSHWFLALPRTSQYPPHASMKGLTGSDLPSDRRRRDQARVSPVPPVIGTFISHCSVTPEAWAPQRGESLPLTTLQATPIFALCAISPHTVRQNHLLWDRRSLHVTFSGILCLLSLGFLPSSTLTHTLTPCHFLWDPTGLTVMKHFLMY
jgi:hypothetical protein